MRKRVHVFGVAASLAAQLETANNRLHEAYQLIASMKREGFEPQPAPAEREPAKRLPVQIAAAIKSATPAGSKERSDMEAYAWGQLSAVSGTTWSKELIDSVANRILRGPEMPGGVTL